MKLSKKQLAIIALVICLASSSITYAVLFMARHVDFSGGIITTEGTIEVYDDDGTTPLTAYDFPLFTGGITEYKYKHFFINNTGTVPVYVYWNLSSSSRNWEVHELGLSYVSYAEGSPDTDKYRLTIYREWVSSELQWKPSDPAPDDGLLLDVGEGKFLRLRFYYKGYPALSESFTFTLSFYAYNE